MSHEPLYESAWKERCRLGKGGGGEGKGREEEKKEGRMDGRMGERRTGCEEGRKSY